MISKLKYYAIINVLKQEIRTMFLNKLNLWELDFNLLEIFSSSSALRKINFDNCNMNMIFSLRLNFDDLKYQYNKEIWRNNLKDGYFVFNKFYIRDSYMNTESIPIVETLDITLMCKVTDMLEKDDLVHKKISIIFQILDEIIEQINQDKNTDLQLQKLNLNVKDIKKFDLKQEDNNTKVDNFITTVLQKKKSCLLENTDKYNSEYFAPFFETTIHNFQKLLIKVNNKIYDLLNVLFDEENSALNMIINWQSLLQIIFKQQIDWYKILDIPKTK